MIKYLKLKPRKIKTATGKIITKHPHLLSLEYSKKMGEKSGYECWVIKDTERRINQFLGELLSNPRFQTEESNIIDTWTGESYENQTELKKEVSQEEIDNPGELQTITETTALTYMGTGDTIEDFQPEKTETELLIEKIKAKGTVDSDVKLLLEKLIDKE